MERTPENITRLSALVQTYAQAYNRGTHTIVGWEAITDFVFGPAPLVIADKWKIFAIEHHLESWPGNTDELFDKIHDARGAEIEIIFESIGRAIPFQNVPYAATAAAIVDMAAQLQHLENAK